MFSMLSARKVPVLAFFRLTALFISAFFLQSAGVLAFQGALGLQPLANPLATFGLPYAATVQASGGTPPYSFQVGVGTGSLPPGLSMTLAGAISGTPTSEGFFRFNIFVTDAANATSSAEFLISVSPPYSSEPLPGAVVGQPYNASVLRTAITVPYPVTLQSGAIPAGLQLNENGSITGTPTAAPSTYNFVVRSTVTPTSVAIRSITVTSNPTTGVNAPDIVGGQLADGRRGVVYAYQFQASGGVPPYRFSLAQGALPPGVGLQDSGSLSGVPGVVGTYQFRVRATGLNGSYSDAGFVLRIVEPGMTLPGGELPVATISRPYSAQISAVGGVAPVRYILVGSALPPNLQFDSTGRISGTPNTGGTFDLFVQAIDANNESASARYSLRIVRPDFRITDTRLPSGRRGEAYAHLLGTADGTAPYNFNLTQGSALPQGLTLTQAGLISGTPLVSGDFNFSVRAIDAQAYTTTSTLTLNVAPTRLGITTTSLPAPSLGQLYRQSIVTSGGTAPFGFSVIAGALPPGLSLSATTGLIDGTPSMAGSYAFTLRVVDGASQTADQAYTLTVSAPQPLSLSSVVLPTPALYAAYSQALQAQGGKAPYGYRLLGGALPTGLALNANGTVAGSPLQAGTFTFTVQVSDATDAVASAQFSLQVASAITLASASTARDYTLPLNSILSGGPYSLAADSASLAPLPAGLSLSADGRITGRAIVPGLHAFTLRSSTGLVFSFLLPVEAEGFQITTAALPPARIGAPYNFSVIAEGGVGFYRWRVRDGSLPPGMVFDPIVGRLEGTPTATGSFRFTAEAIGQDSRSALRSFPLQVGPANLPLVAAVTSAASYAGGGVAPGELLTLFGEPFGASARVLFDGQPAPMIYSFANQSSAVAPFGLKDREYTSVSVERGGVVSLPFVMKVLATKPALFTINGSGRGAGAILNQDGVVNSESSPAAQGSVVVLYATGGGSMTPEGIDGVAATATSSLNLPARVTVNGQNGMVLYAGNAPGLLHGVIQVNVRLPAGLPKGANSVVLLVGAQGSAAGVTVWVE